MDPINKFVKLIFVVGGVLCIVIFTLQDLPILLFTVPLPFLSFIAQLLLLSFLIGTVAVAVIVIDWLWTIFDDDRHKRRNSRARRDLESEEQRRQARSARPNRSTDPTIPVPLQQQQAPPRRSNIYRPRY